MLQANNSLQDHSYLSNQLYSSFWFDVRALPAPFALKQSMSFCAIKTQTRLSHNLLDNLLMRHTVRRRSSNSTATCFRLKNWLAIGSWLTAPSMHIAVRIMAFTTTTWWCFPIVKQMRTFLAARPCSALAWNHLQPIFLVKKWPKLARNTFSMPRACKFTS